jgi:hypothetical protein
MFLEMFNILRLMWMIFFLGSFNIYLSILSPRMLLLPVSLVLNESLLVLNQHLLVYIFLLSIEIKKLPQRINFKEYLRSVKISKYL